MAASIEVVFQCDSAFCDEKATGALTLMYNGLPGPLIPPGGWRGVNGSWWCPTHQIKGFENIAVGGPWEGLDGSDNAAFGWRT